MHKMSSHTAQLFVFYFANRVIDCTGETGLLVAKITQKAQFAGYARDPIQTEKKKLYNVFEKGDVYFNSGDLFRTDQENFLYFQDRVGDTFRWRNPIKIIVLKG